MMDQKTYAALQKSIQHWNSNAQAKSFSQSSVGANNCALCDLFYDSDCEGCPISSATNEVLCDSTPYHNAALEWHELKYDRNNSELIKSFHKHAKAEENFLRSLVPAGGPDDT